MAALANVVVASYHQERPSEPLCLHSLFSATTLPSQRLQSAKILTPHAIHILFSIQSIWVRFSKFCQAFPANRSCSAGDFVLNMVRGFLFLFCDQVLHSCTFSVVIRQSGCSGVLLEGFLPLFGGVYATRILSSKQLFPSWVVFWLDGILGAKKGVPFIQHKDNNRKLLLSQLQLLHGNVPRHNALAAVVSYQSRMCI